MRFVDEDWHSIGAVVSDSWSFTENLLPGTYTFMAEWQDIDGEDWISLGLWELDGTIDPYYAPLSTTVGLLPRRDNYLPLILSKRQMP
jgi:hypothetical protein